MRTTAITETKAGEIVMACIEALNAEDFTKARSYVSDNMQFIGVLGSRDGGDAYFEDMKKMKLKYDIDKAFVNGDDVCLLYHLQLSGTTIYGCGLYHVNDEKIDQLKVIFDPRPVLEKK